MSRSEDSTSELTVRLDRDNLNLMTPRDTGHLIPSLVVIQGVDRGDSISITKTPLVCGRGKNCDYVIRDDGISRVHAHIIRDEVGRYIIEDLGSTNGLFVANERVARHVFSEGDKVLLGRRTILKFVLADAFDQHYQKQMYESAVKDGLTGVYNRKHFDEQLHSEWSFAHRHQTPLTVLIFDLDHFKRINDTYGHQTGDQVLVEVSAKIKQTLREEDFFARYGGEEFVVLARNIGTTGANALAERIRTIVQGLKITNSAGIRVPVTLSIGGVTMPPGAKTSAVDLLSFADKNLYQAKQTGRNRVVTSLAP